MGNTINVSNILMKKNNKGFVYLMQGNEYIKIGFSKDPKGRLYTLNSQSIPFEIYLIATLESDKAHDIEQKLHLKYSDLRVRKEWFVFPEFELLNMIKEYGFTIVSDFKNRPKKTEYQIMKKIASMKSIRKAWYAKDKGLLQVARDQHRESMRVIEKNAKKDQMTQLIQLLSNYRDSFL